MIQDTNSLSNLRAVCEGKGEKGGRGGVYIEALEENTPSHD